MANNQSKQYPFTEGLKEEMGCAISAILGSVEDELNEKMKKDPNLTLKDVINSWDLFDIARKMEWYIFDEVKTFKKDNFKPHQTTQEKIR